MEGQLLHQLLLDLNKPGECLSGFRAHICVSLYSQHLRALAATVFFSVCYWGFLFYFFFFRMGINLLLTHETLIETGLLLNDLTPKCMKFNAKKKKNPHHFLLYSCKCADKHKQCVIQKGARNGIQCELGLFCANHPVEQRASDKMPFGQVDFNLFNFCKNRIMDFLI